MTRRNLTILDIREQEFADLQGRLDPGTMYRVVDTTGRPIRTVTSDGQVVGGGGLALSGIHMPISGTPTNGGASVTSLCMQAWSRWPFRGIRLHFDNYEDAETTVRIAKAAAAATSNAAATSLTWQTAVAGNANTLTVPAGRPVNVGGAPSNGDKPGRASYLPMSILSLERTDGGAGYLAQIRAVAETPFAARVTTSAADIQDYNAATGEGWLGATFTGDNVTTIADFSLTAGLRWIYPLVEFIYENPVVRVLQCGDSLGVGAESTGNTLGPVQIACRTLDSASKHYIFEQLAIVGQSGGNSRETVLARLAVGPKPTVLCRNVWTPNSALSSDAVAETVKGLIASEISAARDAGVKYIVGTSGPVDNQTTTEANRRRALNEWARGLFAAGLVDGLADWGPTVENPANPDRINPSLKGAGGSQSHYNDAGYQIIAHAWRAALERVA